MKKVIIASFMAALIFSLVQTNTSTTFGGKIDYKKIFKNRCLKCHGFDGKGTKRGKKLGSPDFTNAEWQASVTDEQLLNSITNGTKRMPKQSTKLGPEEIKAMVKYVRYFTPKKKK